MNNENKQRLQEDLVKISKQIGILSEEIPRLIIKREEMHQLKLNHPRFFRTGNDNIDKRTGGYGECDYNARIIFVDCSCRTYHRTTYHGRKSKRFHLHKKVKAMYRDHLHTLVEELVHYRFAYLQEGRKLEGRIQEVIRGKTFPAKHVCFCKQNEILLRTSLSQEPTSSSPQSMTDGSPTEERGPIIMLSQVGPMTSVITDAPNLKEESIIPVQNRQSGKLEITFNGERVGYVFFEYANWHEDMDNEHDDTCCTRAHRDYEWNNTPNFAWHIAECHGDWKDVTDIRFKTDALFLSYEVLCRDETVFTKYIPLNNIGTIETRKYEPIQELEVEVNHMTDDVKNSLK